ncbi:MAG: glycosyltransferase [Clostridiales bacterium]|nr:glycosyltransferase [Clostridiales bacterium]
MKVLHVITGLNDGGAESALYRLIIASNPEAHVVVSLMDEGKYGRLLERAGSVVHCLRMRKGRLRVDAPLRLWKIMRAEKPDVVQTWMYHADLIGGIVAKAAGIRRVCWGVHHARLDKSTSSRATRMIARLNAVLSYVVPSTIICCAQSALDAHRDIGFASDKMIVVPNGYNLQHFAPSEAARERLRTNWGVDEKAAVLGMVGRLHPDKDHENLLQALSALARRGVVFTCVLVGNGLDSANRGIQERLAAWNVNDSVMLLGRQEDIPAVMNAIDIHVLSSRTEAFPNVICEAMACGTPCVTTAVGDARTIVGQTGWVVPPRDSDALADAIVSAIELMKRDSDWTRRKFECRGVIVQRYDIKDMVQSYRAAWSEQV